METALAVTLLRLPQVEAATGLKKTKLYQLIKEGAFPEPVAIGRSRLFRSDEVQDFILSRPRASEQEVM